MRLAVITPGFSATEDDWCIPALLNLVRALAREHEVHVFTIRYPHHVRGYQVAGASVYPFGGRDTRGFERAILLQRVFAALMIEHRRTPFDVVHAFWADEPGILATAFGRMTGVPSVVSIMGGELVRFGEIEYGGQLSLLNRRMTSFALHNATCVTVGSRYLRAIATDRFTEGSPVLAPLGVDTRMYSSELGLEVSDRRLDGCPAILMVGSLVPVKNHRLALHVVARIVHDFPGLKLHLVGDGPLRDELSSHAAEIGIGEHVALHGDVEHHHLPDYYRSADLFMSTSRHESQGMAILEAAACGCPVIGTAVGVLPEISSHFVPIPPGDSGALAELVCTLIRDETRRDSSRETALEYVRTQYSLDVTIPRLVSIYRDISRR